jgi:polyferredoxin
MKPKNLANSTAGFSLVDALFTLVQILIIATGFILLRDLFGLNVWIATLLGILLGLVVMFAAWTVLFKNDDRIGRTKNKLS